jgi:AcrR family transcriptional regulator
LATLLKQYEDVFRSPSLCGTGASTLGELTPECIPIIPGSTPFNRPPFRLSHKEKAEVEQQVKDALEKQWIEQSSSAYGAPVLFVPKPDGSLRMCIDYRGLNKITVKNKFPMPRIDDLLDNLSGATHFSTLDLAAGYHQLKLQESDVPKTAFNTHFGKFEWRVLPFGLTNAPAVFQHAMNRIFGSHLNKCVCVYLDDILIFSRSEEEHFLHLEMVLHLLRQHNLFAKMKKCEFFKPELKYLGHVVSGAGVKPDPSKVETIAGWPTPSSVHEVRQFLGLANYFRKFIRGYAAMTAPLTDLLKGLSKQERAGVRSRFRRHDPDAASASERAFAARWTTVCDTAFAAVRRALTSAPVLALPDHAKHFTLVSDACQSPPAVGAVLLQDGHPVSYFSRKLSGPELNYSVSDIEMLAVICALREWRCYLEGAQFTIVTDHQPNTYLDVATSAHTLKRRARWLDVACGYDYTWCYRPGRTNVADPVSRAPQHFALLAAVTVLHLDRHQAVAIRLPNPRCCAFCQAKATRNTRRTQTAGRDAGRSGVDRAAQGLRSSDGGG